MSETDKTRGVNLALLEAFTDMLTVPRWCVWYWQGKTNTKTGRKWKTKVGLVPGTITHVRVNEAVGTTYAVARAAALVGDGVAGVGWRVLDDIRRVWIDIDKCRDPVTGVIAPWARVLLDWAPEAYREITPSGTGMRLLGVTTDLEPFSAHMKMAPLLSSDADLVTADWFGGRQEHQPRAGIEIYHACARFVTVTGHEGRGRADVDLTELAAWLMGLARAHGGNDHVSRGRAGAAVALDPDLTGPIEDIVAALAVMKNEAVPWDIWNNIGMATVNAAGREAGESIFEAFEAFDAWSEKCPEKYDPEETTERWDHWLRVSPADQLGIGTLMRLAREADPTWRRPSRRPEAEFVVVDLPPGSPTGPATPAGGKKAEPETAEQRVAFSRLAARLTYDAVLHRFHDLVTGELWDEARLHAKAGELRIHGAGTRGAGGLTMRLMRTAGHEGGIMVTHGLVAAPGDPRRHVESENEHGRVVLMLNTWVPPATLAGDVEGADAGVWLAHVERLIPDVADRERVLDRLAWAVQHPGVKINSALLLLGRQKTGKDTMLEPFWAAIGTHNMRVVPGKDIGGDFNEYLLKPWLLVSEVPSFRKRSCYEDIKGWLTTPPRFLRINLKGLPAYAMRNIVNAAVTSNHDDAMALPDDDRRFDVVMTAAADRGEGDAYFDRLYAWYAAGGLGAAARWLRERDVGGRFHAAHEPPVTVAKQAMIRQAEAPGVSWARSLWAGEDGADGPLVGRRYVTVEEILEMARRGEWGAGPIGTAAGKGMPRQIAQALRVDGWSPAGTQVPDGGHRAWVWCRGENMELVRLLKVQALRERLEKDRIRASFGA